MKLSPKLKCHQNGNVTKTKISPKLQCYLNYNVTKTKMPPKLKCYKMKKCPKNQNLNQIKIQDIGTDHLGLVVVYFLLFSIIKMRSVQHSRVPKGRQLQTTVLGKYRIAGGNHISCVL